MKPTRPWTWGKGADADKRIVVGLIFLVNLTMVIWIWLAGLGHMASFGNIAVAASHLCALVGTYLILIQLLLLARIDLLEQAFGKDGLTRIHRLVGHAAFYAIFGHVLLLTIGYSFVYNVSYITQFIDFITNYEDVWKAFVAFVLLLAVVGLSVAAARKVMKFELWYFIHLTAYLMVLLAFGHQIAVGPDFIMHPWFARYWMLLYSLTFGIIFIYRFLTPIYNYWRHRFKVAKVVRETPDVVSIYITGRDMAKFKYEAGQFANWYFIDGSRWWQGHPFSFSAAPNDSYLRITVKDLGEYTHNIDNLKPGTPVVIDGPNGRFTPRIRRHDGPILIAGGVGIAPIRSILEAFGRDGVHRVSVLYTARTTPDIALKDEIDRLAGFYGYDVSYILSRDKLLPKQRINIDVIRNIAPDFLKREIYLCGPVAMMKDVEGNLISAGMPATRIYSEQFNF
jgi:predicted ferric reductase